MVAFELQIFALRTFISLLNLMENIWNYGRIFFQTMTNMPTTGNYVFFEGYTTAIPYVELRQEDGLAKISWKYDKHEKVLTYSNCETFAKKHLPWLSAIIHCNDSHLCNLDDFVSSIQVQTNGQLPSPRMIVACWSLDSNLYFELHNNVKLTVITDMGEEKEYSIWNDEPISAD